MKELNLTIPIEDEKDITLQELLSGVLSYWYKEPILIGDVRIKIIAQDLFSLEEMKFSYKLGSGIKTDYLGEFK